MAKPQEATPTSPAKNIPEPVMPAAAKKNTAEGLEAFTRYWFEVHNYAQKTGDTKQMMALCVEESAFCDHRKESVDQFTERNAWMIDGDTIISTYFSDQSETPAGYKVSIVEIDQEGRKVYNSDGPIVEANLKSTSGAFESYSIWRDGGWRFLAIDPIDGVEYEQR
ncbi:hypothetical protein HD598_000479 [Neomicrococcus aestuarii]|uniref:DUF6318 domain-containing protein n=1 Tax=Neomicrococcus aestuarii TaxID=556325 RepID=A0A7W8WZ17_9MICC|nr:DUF6318 family protein [Neomicrococcus aestuarii]MBB5511792.1 hypothetical protein [Neomicrococcus aestuarii]